jgi:hypothetical protein
MSKFNTFLAMGILIIASGCTSNQYSVTYASDPSGAQLYCNADAQGYTPVTLYYTLAEEAKASGVLKTRPCVVKWVSGATATANSQFNLSQFPNGVITTTPRPNVEGYSQDAEFALKVRALEANETAANAAQQNSNNQMNQYNNTVNCKKMGEFLNVEIKTFSGTFCPMGWVTVF